MMAGGVGRRVFFLLAVGALLAGGGRTAAAGVGGSAELASSSSRIKSFDATGLETDQNVDSYFQRYVLNVSDQLYPNLFFQANGIMEKVITLNEVDGQDQRTTGTRLVPSASLVLTNPFVSAGVGYYKREDIASIYSATSRQYNDSANAFFTWSPESLPRINVNATHTNRYDRDKLTQNIRDDVVLLSVNYSPVRPLTLQYNKTWSDNNDVLHNTESTTENQFWSIGYSDQFFQNRVSLTTDYRNTDVTTEFTSGHGAFKLQRFPLAGLSAVSLFNAAPPPATITGTLTVTPAVIDGNLTASTGINIGQSVSLGGDTRFRQVGLDLQFVQEVNTLDLYVALNLNQSLPSTVADTFSWYIYTSVDGQTWNLYQGGVPALFDPFTNQFEIVFPSVITRYIMAMVQPLPVSLIPPLGTDVSNIFITELQGFSVITSTYRNSTNTARSEAFDLNLRATLTERPLIFYNLYFSEAKSDPGSRSFDMINTLTASQRLNDVFGAAASVYREQTEYSGGVRGSANGYSASLTADPLPTFHSSFVMGGRYAEQGGISNSNNSAFLYGSAQLIRGIDVNASVGESIGSTSSVLLGKVDTSNTQVSAGATVTPNSKLTINLSASQQASASAKGEVTTRFRTMSQTAGVSYVPVQTVYLFYQVSQSQQGDDKRQRVYNYSFSWSPLASGTLRLSLGYFETLQTGVFEQFDRTKSATVSWGIAPRAILSANYAIAKTESPVSMVESNTFGADLKIRF